MKIAFVTCVQLGLSCINEIYSSGYKLDLLITLPDEKSKNKSGRIYLDNFANENEIPIIKSNHINDTKVLNAIKQYDIDWLFIIGWSQIAGSQIINAPNFGTIGAHPTLLPEGRGRAAIPWAILKGLKNTGVTFFKIDEEVDTGQIIDQKVIPISSDETASTLYRKVELAHITLIQRVYQKILEGKLSYKEQDESKATYWPGRKPEDGEITETMLTDQVDRLVRATTRPYPGAFIFKNFKKVIIWSGFKSDERISDATLYEIALKDGYFYANDFSIEKS